MNAFTNESNQFYESLSKSDSRGGDTLRQEAGVPAVQLLHHPQRLAGGRHLTLTSEVNAAQEEGVTVTQETEDRLLGPEMLLSIVISESGVSCSPYSRCHVLLKDIGRNAISGITVLSVLCRSLRLLPRPPPRPLLSLPLPQKLQNLGVVRNFWIFSETVEIYATDGMCVYLCLPRAFDLFI